jgi:hypothetical protein
MMTRTGQRLIDYLLALVFFAFGTSLAAYAVILIQPQVLRQRPVLSAYAPAAFVIACGTISVAINLVVKERSPSLAGKLQKFIKRLQPLLWGAIALAGLATAWMICKPLWNG